MVSVIPNQVPERKNPPSRVHPALIRRESASTIDEFLEDILQPTDTTEVSVSVNMKVSCYQGPQMGPPPAAHRTTPARQVPQIPTPDWQSGGHQPENSTSSFFEELFGPAAMDLKPKFPSTELPVALEKMPKFWDLEEMEIQDDPFAARTCSERTSSASSASSAISRTPSDSHLSNGSSNFLSRSLSPVSQGPSHVQIKTEPDPMSCSFAIPNALAATKVPAGVKMEPPVPSYAASCRGPPGVAGLIAQSNVRPSFLPLPPAGQSSGAVAIKPRPVFNAGSSFPASGLQSNIPMTLQSVIFPPTPPDSKPNSPSQQQQGPRDVRHTPPPPYPGSGVAILPAPTQAELMKMGLITSTGKPRQTHPGCTTIKYNRRNNPDLDKRRIHHCEFPGKNFRLCDSQHVHSICSQCSVIFSSNKQNNFLPLTTFCRSQSPVPLTKKR